MGIAPVLILLGICRLLKVLSMIFSGCSVNRRVELNHILIFRDIKEDCKKGGVDTRLVPREGHSVFYLGVETAKKPSINSVASRAPLRLR